MASAPVALQGPAEATTTVAEVAPYFETTGAHRANLMRAVTHHGLTTFTAAFVLGKRCVPTWDDHSPLTGTDGRSLRVEKAAAAGARPIVSFGGQTGRELARGCATTRDLVVAYTKVIKRLRTRKLDFDIEGRASLDATVVNTRRFKAIRALEAKFPRLEVSLTIPVARDGIDTGYADGDGIAFLELAKRVRARIDVVNLMTMDYGDTVTDMGQAAITSATRALAQIRKIWPRDTYANLGITPMIGENDSPGETFTLADARTAVGFAEAHGVRRLAFWAVNRDQSCGAGDHALDTCTGLAPSRLDYTDAFLA